MYFSYCIVLDCYCYQPVNLLLVCFCSVRGWGIRHCSSMGEDGVQGGSWFVPSSINPLFHSQLSPSADLAVAVFLTFTGGQKNDTMSHQDKWHVNFCEEEFLKPDQRAYFNYLFIYSFILFVYCPDVQQNTTTSIYSSIAYQYLS